MDLRPFHLAFPVTNLDQARAFYGEVLGYGTTNDAHHMTFGLPAAHQGAQVRHRPQDHRHFFT